MSMKLVRKFLQQDDANAPSEGDGGESKPQQQRRKRRLGQDPSRTAVSEDEALQATIRSLTYLDGAMETLTGKSDSKNKAMKRIQKEARDAKKRRKASRDAMVGNSRSSSSQLRVKAPSTFNKKRHKKEKEEKRLKEIANLLNKRKLENK